MVCFFVNKLRTFAVNNFTNLFYRMQKERVINVGHYQDILSKAQCSTYIHQHYDIKTMCIKQFISVSGMAPTTWRKNYQNLKTFSHQNINHLLVWSFWRTFSISLVRLVTESEGRWTFVAFVTFVTEESDQHMAGSFYNRDR